MQVAISFIDQWLGGLSGVLISFTGLLLCVLVAGAFWDKRGKYSELFIVFLCGLLLTFNKTSVGFVTRLFGVQEITAYWSLLPLVYIIAGIILLKWIVQLKSGASQYHKSSVFTDGTYGRTVRGTTIGAPLIIGICALAVVLTGLSAPQVMIGDEVTHYYMLTKQAEDLSKPNFFAEIPIAIGDVEVRRYPHSFLWHYIGAVIFFLTGRSFIAIQCFQTLFLIQFLTIAYLLAKDRGGVESRSALVYLLVLASLPITLIFSVTFYQDVPMTAQILTAFYLLKRGRWFWASIFLSLAIGFKVTAVLFYPPFFLLLFYWQIRQKGWLRSIVYSVCALLVVLSATWMIGKAIVVYGESFFYPQYQLEKIVNKAKDFFEPKTPVVAEKNGKTDINKKLSTRPEHKKNVKKEKPPIIANHPGDLRIKINFLVYGGILLWLVIVISIVSMLINFVPNKEEPRQKRTTLWFFFTGGIYTIIAVWYLRTSPDARFFLPGLPFLLLPIAEKAVKLPKPKIIVSIVAVIALLQGGYVLQKTYKLRAITPEMQEGIDYLTQNPPSGHIFMYPEGNYRFFPAQHEWYLGYRLKDFWRGDNDARIALMKKFGISVVVIKKHLVGTLDQDMTNLGIYPAKFVDDLKDDKRFVKTFENNELLMFKLVDPLP